MDKIIIHQAKIPCHIGITQKERNIEQEILLDISMSTDIAKSAKTDSIHDTINYSRVFSLVKEMVQAREYHLIETIAEDIANKILQKFATKEVTICLKKPQALSDVGVAYTAVEITRSWSNTALIGLGSNVEDKKQHIQKAIHFLEEKCKVTKISPLYWTEPVGYSNQDYFINSCLEIKTSLSPKKLLSFLLSIEKKLKRVRTIKNGPRTIDIDLLFYNDIIVSESNLSIPHPRLHLRHFVLKPLMDICPRWIHPGFNKTVQQLATELTQMGINNGIEKLPNF